MSLFSKIKDLFQADRAIKRKQEELSNLENSKKAEISGIENRISDLSRVRANSEAETKRVQEALADLTKKHDSESKKYLRLRSAYASLQNAVKNSPDDVPIEYSVEELDGLLSPTVSLHFHSQDLRDLRKRASEINKQIDAVQKTYEARYTTKAVRAMYQFMTLALRSELQNILYNLKYDKLEKNLISLHSMLAKFEKIAVEGNQQIAPTIKKFLSQMGTMFEELIKIEYEYYVQQERIKEEQRALREKMREEAAERRELERQKQQLEKEASKYTSEIETLRTQAAIETDGAKNDLLMKRIEELESMVAGLNEKREEIVNLANGKAGHVYVISNLGAFGDNVFKVGMTRRLDPQERIDELGSASVPFGFDVHSLIFSEDAVGLETALHTALNEKRVNKVNLRKEFFRTSLDELEHLVYQYDPSASFNRTMLAEQYRQTLAIEQNLIDFDPTASEGNDEDDE
jgi:DNA repair exonuclease SbcCD ATPase subunit